MIVTTYTPDGKKVRKPTGYGGQLCHEATAPYEAREIGTAKTPTPEATLAPAQAAPVEERQPLRG